MPHGIKSGSTVPDETGRGNDLLLQGGGHTLGAPGSIAGDVDTSIRFDGISSYAIATDAGPFTFPGGAPFSIECWVTRDVPDGGGDFDQYIFNDFAFDGPPQNGYYLLVQPDAGANVALRFVYAPTDGGPPTQLFGPMSAPSTVAYYVVTSGGGTSSLYVDGTLIKQLGTGVIVAHQSPFSVAGDATTQSLHFPGTIDEFAIYDKVLTIEQILHHHDVGTGNAPAP